MKRGEVIGLATFGSLEQNTGNLASGYNFAIPVSVMREYLDSRKYPSADQFIIGPIQRRPWFLLYGAFIIKL